MKKKSNYSLMKTKQNHSNMFNSIQDASSRILAANLREQLYFYLLIKTVLSSIDAPRLLLNMILSERLEVLDFYCYC